MRETAVRGMSAAWGTSAVREGALCVGSGAVRGGGAESEAEGAISRASGLLRRSDRAIDGANGRKVRHARGHEGTRPRGHEAQRQPNLKLFEQLTSATSPAKRRAWPVIPR